jgi:BNR repeat-containing family member
MAQSVLSEGPTLIRLDHLPAEVALLLQQGLPDGVSLDMSGYLTDAELTAAVAGLASDEDVAAIQAALAGKATTADVAAVQAAVARAYVKPTGGIPASDLAPGVIPTNAPVDAAALAASPELQTAFGRGIAQDGAYSMAVAIPDAAPRTLYSTQNPCAVYDATSRKTFVAFLGGYRRLYVTAYDHDSAVWLEPVYAGPYYIANTDDDHGAPSLVIDSAGYIIVIYGTHGESGGSGIARSKNPRDISAWTSGRASGMPAATYVSTCADPTSTAVYATFRTGGGHGSVYPCHEIGTIIRSTDHGATWTDLGAATSGLIDTHVASFAAADACSDYYVTDCEWRDGKVWVAWAIAHGPVHDGPRHGANVAYYDTADGHMHAFDGTDLGAKIDTAAKMAKCAITALDQDYVYPVRLGLRPGSAEMVVLCNRYDSTADLVRVMAAKWSGTTWTTTDTGIVSNFLYYGTGISYRDGRWEGFCGSLRTGDRTIAALAQGDIIAQASGGADLLRITSADGVTWATADTWSASQFVGSSGMMYVQTVQNAHPDLIALTQAIELGTVKDSATGDQDGGTTQGAYTSPRTASPVWSIHARTNLPRQGSRTVRPDITHRHNPWYKVFTAQAASTSWQTVDLSTVVPRGTREVRLKVTATGTGTAGPCTLSFREGGTTRRSDEDFTVLGEWAFPWTQTVPVPLSPNRTFEWKGSATNTTVSALLAATVMGTVGRTTGAPTTAGPAIPDVTPPSKPGTPTASATGLTVTVTTTGSTDNVGVTGYDWYRTSATAQGAVTVKAGSTVGSTFTDTNLPDAIPVTYTVQAKDQAGNLSAMSTASASVTPTARLSGADTFNRADAATTGNGWVSSHSSLGWTFPIAGNAVTLAGATGTTAYDIAPGTAATADQYMEIDVTARGGSSSSDPSALVRYANVTADGNGGNADGYFGRYSPSAGAWQLYKVVAGAVTALGTPLVEAAPALPYTTRVEAVGSTVRVLGGPAGGTLVEKVKVTDASVTAGRRTAIGMRFAQASDNTMRVDAARWGDV